MKIPYFAVALLLTATAGAKLWVLLTDRFADIRIQLPITVLWISVFFELLLAYENVRVVDRHFIAFINMIAFVFLALFSTVRIAMGYNTCGCSGNIELPSWVFVVVDLGIVAWFSGETLFSIMYRENKGEEP